MSDINIVVSLRSIRWRIRWDNGQMAVSDWLFGIGETSLRFYMGYMSVHDLSAMVDWREPAKCKEEQDFVGELSSVCSCFRFACISFVSQS